MFLKWNIPAHLLILPPININFILFSMPKVREEWTNIWFCWCFSTNRAHALDLCLVFISSTRLKWRLPTPNSKSEGPEYTSTRTLGEDEYDPSIMLGRPFLNTNKTIIYIGTGEIHFRFHSEKVRRHFNSDYMFDEQPKKNKEKAVYPWPKEEDHCIWMDRL